MRRSLVLVTFFLFFLLSQSLLRHFPTMTYRVDGVWLMVLFLGLYVETFPGLLWVFVIGLAQESLGAPLHGTIVLSYLILYLFLRLVHGHLFVYGKMAQLVWVFFLSLAYKVIEASLLTGLDYEGVPLKFLLLMIPALLQGLVSLILFPWIQALIGSQRSHDYVS